MNEFQIQLLVIMQQIEKFLYNEKYDETKDKKILGHDGSFLGQISKLWIESKN